MTEFRHGHSGASSWDEAVTECVAALRPLPEGANLGFVYATDAFAQNLPAIVGQLKRATNVGDWVGTVGIGVCASGREYFDGPGLAVMVGAFPEGSFHVVPTIKSEIGQFHADSRSWIAQAEPQLGIIHADPRNERVPGLIGDLAATSRSFLVGGLTSSRGQYWQVAGDGAAEGGISGVLIAGAVPVATALSQGCSPVGPKRTITGCQDNIITHLDGETALDVLKQDIGPELARDLRHIGGIIFAALPVPGTDTGDYLVRNLVGIDPARGWLAIAAEVSEGDRLMFCRRARDTAVEDLKRMLAQLKRRTGDAAPKGAVYISCLARGPNTFGPDSAELAILREALGDLPLVGFYANGEISHGRLYGYTGVLTLFL
ncbi:MAG: histidine kinase [Alphaproteobacteria bacterium]|nr:histidine kinase [Alphaproteobacteria bacterium]